MYNPLSLVLNGSYDIIQLDGHKRTIFSFPYRTSFDNVFRNLGHPFGSISRYGWNNFFRNEILPLNWNARQGQWWPNYQLHLIGGGMTYVATREWYEHYGFPVPAILSIATMASYHLLNEAVEDDGYVGDTVDPIADIYIFDLGGIILFSFDGINEFFSRTLNLADWSLQPSFTLTDGALYNNGQYFSIKWKLPFSENIHLFYYFGMNGLIGLSYKTENGSALSFGAGLRSKNLEVIDPSTNQKMAKLVWNAGVFFDRENSLLASLFISGLTDNFMTLNIYPGVIRTGFISPGVWITLGNSGNLMCGITTMWTPGIAIGRR